jgi:hypothetical protein
MCANKWFCCLDLKSVIEGIFWKLTKKQIFEWLEGREKEFGQKENRNPQMSDEK